MRLRRSRDDGRVRAVQGPLDRRRHPATDRSRRLGRPARVDIGDQDLVNTRFARDERAMETPDLARAKERDSHSLALRHQVTSAPRRDTVTCRIAPGALSNAFDHPAGRAAIRRRALVSEYAGS